MKMKKVLQSFICTGVFLLLPEAVPTAMAANPVVAVPGVALQVNRPLEDNLRALVGRRVTVTLDSGSQVAGRIKALGSGLLHLENLTGKSFMDALVRIDRIQAVDTQVRAYQRDLGRFQ